MTVFTGQEFARRLELYEGYGIANSIETLKRVQPQTGGTVERVAGAYAIFAGQDSGISRTIGLGMNGAVVAADVERVEEFYRSRQAPAQIDLCPLADASLRALLNERGYGVHEFNNCWFQPLEDYAATVPLADGVSVREAEAPDADAWIQSVSLGFAEREDMMTAEVEVATTFFNEPGTRCFLSFVDGEPAGGGAMFIHEKLAAFFSGSTIPAARGRGAQTALLHARLQAAQAEGCDFAIIKTSPGNASQRNVQRAGFHLAYTKPTMRRQWT
jgi:GNAT superfamily N-acetyltransferase